MKIYLAGSMFSEAEIAQRRREANILREELDGADVYNPIEAGFNDDKSTLPTPQDIYEGDFGEVMKCRVFVVDLGCTHDPGVAVEIGMVAGYNEYLRSIHEQPIYIIGHLSDIRVPTANKYDIPSYGINHLLLGTIEANGKVVSNFDEVVKELKELDEYNTV